MPRALLSVSDKTGIVDLARGLVELGFEVVSTGGTSKTLREQGVPVTYISDVTNFPEILDGRVKTLHPRVHGGILALRTPQHLAQLEEHGIEPIDLVAVNLYPFRETVARPGVTLGQALENIDIGGPTMVRASAKNHPHVIILVNPRRYGEVLAQLRETGTVSPGLRKELAQEAFAHTAAYDQAIAAYLGQPEEGEAGLPDSFLLAGEKVQSLRYGENPHQQAAFYRLEGSGAAPGTLAAARQLQGKELSFNNLVDLEAAWRLVREFEAPAVVIIKHTNPCGLALGHDPVTAFQRAWEADPLSAFGGVVALNRPLDSQVAAQMKDRYIEAVIAPAVEGEAMTLLAEKTNLRVMDAGGMLPPGGWDIKPVSGGFLVQSPDWGVPAREEMEVVTPVQPEEKDWQDLLFAWRVVKHVKSNAIVVAGDQVTLGVGAGQMNRVGAARIALEQAGEKARGAVLASDAFFPFRDTVDLAASFGIRAIIQPGGSVRDQESVEACAQHGLAMVFTHKRHFKH